MYVCIERERERKRERERERETKCMEEEKLGKFEALIEHAVDLNKIPDEYVISAEFDDTLGLLEQQKKSTEEEINCWNR